jgi:hypothetical protein
MFIWRLGFPLFLSVLIGTAWGEVEEPADVAASLRGNLVAVKDGVVVPFDDASLGATKYFVLYFGAGTDGPTRRFTENLVRLYPAIKAANPPLEFIFISSDPAQQDMEDFLIASKFPWPALAWQVAQTDHLLNHYAGRELPALVMIDAEGKIVSSTFEGKLYRGPSVVLADIGRRFQIEALLPAAERKPTPKPDPFAEIRRKRPAP